MSSGSACIDSREAPRFGARVLLLLVEAYRATLSPLLGGHCRFWPSCSIYAEEAIRLHGALRGTSLAVQRLLKCQPFHRGGYDPVPGTRPTEPAPSDEPADGRDGL